MILPFCKGWGLPQSTAKKEYRTQKDTMCKKIIRVLKYIYISQKIIGITKLGALL